MERIPRSDPCLKGVNRIQQLRIDRIDSVRAMIAQQLVDRPQGVALISPARPVFSGQPFACMGVEQRDLLWRGQPGGGLPPPWWRKGSRRGGRAPGPPTEE